MILANSDVSHQQLVRALADIGIPFVGDGHSVSFAGSTTGEVTTEVEARFENIHARAISKIAFNYLAKMLGAEFALRPEFNGIRGFVRYGEGAAGSFFTFDSESRFRSAAGAERRHSEHVLLLDWNDRRDELIVRVQLFGGDPVRRSPLHSV